MFILENVTCGTMSEIVLDSSIPRVISLMITLIKVVVPVLLIVFGMLDLGKAVMANKEDEIKKGQQTFVKRLIAAVLVFLSIFLSQLIIGLVAPRTDTDNESMWSCVDCLISYDEENCPSAEK
ncbi:MAG: hypothetical protein J6B98_01440 [Bacilli bacterium]|nr:hypothetical protein [Bacilli bacterium]